MIQSPLAELEGAAMIATTWPPPIIGRLVISRYPGIAPTSQTTEINITKSIHVTMNTILYPICSPCTRMIRLVSVESLGWPESMTLTVRLYDSFVSRSSFFARLTIPVLESIRKCFSLDSTKEYNSLVLEVMGERS